MVINKEIFMVKIETERDFLFCLSSIILSQKEKFTYDNILKEVDKKLKIPNNIYKEDLIKKTLGELCEDGLIEKYSTVYNVVKI
jgi:hypothetical protein